MRTLDGVETTARLPWPALREALRQVFREGCDAPLRHRHPLPQNNAAEGSLLLMPAWQAHRFTGVKIVHVNPSNALQPGLKAVHSVYLLSHGETGEPLCLLDGGTLTDRRTAAASVLAAEYLARPESSRLLLLGSGKVAHALAEAYAERFPLREIRIWSRRPDSAARLAATLAAAGLPAHAVPEADPAGADIIAAATLSTIPLLDGAAVQPGTHVDLVGAFRPDMRESDGTLVRRARLFVDTRTGALAEAGDVVQAIAEGAIDAGHIQGDLFDLCRGQHPGRGSAEDITLFKSVGWAGEDLAAAVLAYQRV
ncbi:bifunctional Delta(1)-pyrroline-2-carboxylate/Delta(1)-piperideine-2-carboxylate reductase [Pseudoroseomonas ludipueritiae]|uniref:Ornithine cyclodeaminase family protein n=1 Tax=Pseudoroseomonas ludipueritiae TaxID=198093 RepID=A0ABR7RBS6_9PROT|nr:ornithine cyclodeaminase family protein [Pseudoroseomonas ludipueritiae]MBC9179275.1 ornithine cyclodeaminase family protein [Pseudoroseomonas ludipueritiae]